MDVTSNSFKLVIAFDGTNYNGWQIQPDCPTIQGRVQDAIGSMFNEKIPLIGSSRTDSGVHANGMVASFKPSKHLSPRSIQAGLNALLPRDIAIVSCEEMPPDFNARKHAIGKRYCYRIYNQQTRSPLNRQYSWHIPIELNWKKITEATFLFLGKQDFSAFMASDSNATTFVRTINSIYINNYADNHLYEIYIEGSGFLKHMVRNIIGTLYDVGRGKISRQKIVDILLSKDRTNAGMTAPAQGLTLEQVFYPADPHQQQS